MMFKIRRKIKSVIFGTETRAGKLFDEVLIVTIILSIVTVLLDSVLEYHENYGWYFYFAEWIFTILFSIEYLLRAMCIRRPLSYIKFLWYYRFSFDFAYLFKLIFPRYPSSICN